MDHDVLVLARSYALAVMVFARQEARLQVLTGDRLAAALTELGLPAGDVPVVMATLLVEHVATVGDSVLLLREITPADLVPVQRPSLAQALDAAQLDRPDVANLLSGHHQDRGALADPEDPAPGGTGREARPQNATAGRGPGLAAPLGPVPQGRNRACVLMGDGARFGRLPDAAWGADASRLTAGQRWAMIPG